NYEVTRINLAHIRQTIGYMLTTHAYIKYFADRLNLQDRPGDASDLLSVSYVANRLVSLKLEPRQHPIKSDTVWRLFLLGIAASLQRFDVSLPMKCLYLLWFTAMLLAPLRLARWLAVKFSFPSTREQLNKILRSFHSAQ
ncbi:MAG TPA: hypothetical protein VFU22_24375, partial [Roseiflexaceae bacterium]|nr:hypothetical protein [Roseiflexaceae bacterium]